MNDIPVFYLLFVLLGCLLAIVAVWSRKKLWVRAGAVLLLVALVSLNYNAMMSLLGYPLPIEDFTFDSEEGDSVVLAASIDEGVAIYLWLRHPGERAPRYYKMGWDLNAAKALKSAMDQSSRDGSGVMMRPGFEESLEIGRKKLFYALPHERLPLKPVPELFEYKNPDISI